MFVIFSVMPLRISTITGFVLSGLGAIGGAAVIGEALLCSPPESWATLMAAVLPDIPQIPRAFEGDFPSDRGALQRIRSPLTGVGKQIVG